MRQVSVDFETYSDVDIKKAGLYKYTESPAFDILLVAYAIDDEPVQILDLAQGDDPEPFLSLAFARDVSLHSYNAAFEHAALNRYLRRWELVEIPLSRWRCTMAHGLYLGYPAGLAAIGEAMGLPQDKRKLGIGQALIRKFCVPQKGAKARPGTHRIMPDEEPEKWELFKTYCKQDVETEREIGRRLSRWPMPEREQELWEITTEANMEGVGVDMDLVAGALAMGAEEQAALEAEAKELSGLDNPKSVQQLLKWLNTEMETDEETEVKDLRKATVADMLAAGVPSDKASRMLELRQLMSKTSTKKFDALEAAVCADGRVRGMMFYYGAARTGRWAGRIVQPQNLPQNHLDSLAFARERVKAVDTEMVKICWGSVPDTLSQLIRTAFVPRPGKLYAVADYSAIEARVVAWLAGEEWVLDAFRAGKDIYCETASQMFGVPVEKHGANAELRQKGKVATLACIAEGQLVLTSRGLVPIEQVRAKDMLWDGESWVHHDGVIYKGEREVITYDGLTATEDHLVWVEGQPEPVRFGLAATSGARLIRSGAGGQAIRLGENHQLREAMERDIQPLPCADPMPGMQGNTVDESEQSPAGHLQRLPGVLPAEADPEMAEQAADCSKAAVRKSGGSELSPLRCPRGPIRLPERDGCGAVPDRALRRPGQGDGAGQDRQQRQLCSGEHPTGNPEGERREPGGNSPQPIRPAALAIRGDCSPEEAGSRGDPGADHPGRDAGGGREAEVLAADKRTARLYDLRNAGRHHRFTVSGRLVHNCGYGGGEGALVAMGALKMGIPEEHLTEIKNRWREANPNIVKLWRKMEAAAIRTVETGETTAPTKYTIIRRETDATSNQDFLTIEFPVGRKIFYAHPYTAPAKNFPDRRSLHYYSISQASKKWGVTDTFSGKIVENCRPSPGTAWRRR